MVSTGLCGPLLRGTPLWLPLLLSFTVVPLLPTDARRVAASADAEDASSAHSEQAGKPCSNCFEFLKDLWTKATEDPFELPCYVDGGRHNFKTYVDAYQRTYGKGKLAVYIFDFDDTLFPTSFVLSIADRKRIRTTNDSYAGEGSRRFTDADLQSAHAHATQGFQVVKDMLHQASELGVAIILTNAGVGWVQMGRDELVRPGIVGEKEFFDTDLYPVIYAPDFYARLMGKAQASGEDFVKSKPTTMKYIARELQLAGFEITGWFTMGDQEHDLIHHIKQEPKVTAKSIKLRTQGDGPGRGALASWSSQMLTLLNAGLPSVLHIGEQDENMVINEQGNLVRRGQRGI